MFWKKAAKYFLIEKLASKESATSISKFSKNLISCKFRPKKNRSSETGNSFDIFVEKKPALT
jgi:hypothetical protein